MVVNSVSGKKVADINGQAEKSAKRKRKNQYRGRDQAPITPEISSAFINNNNSTGLFVEEANPAKKLKSLDFETPYDNTEWDPSLAFLSGDDVVAQDNGVNPMDLWSIDEIDSRLDESSEERSIFMICCCGMVITYVDRAGAAAMEELVQQTREVLAGKPLTCNIFSQQLLGIAIGEECLERQWNHSRLPVSRRKRFVCDGVIELREKKRISQRSLCRPYHIGVRSEKLRRFIWMFGVG
ncbi:unnamed protein product [Microthlaspi erraticum]|uniref:Uncharacterized protein n=1 Tax=Microthlaspi erraticum TaxID=1685480 RepID=A0A6D2KYT3_9BRAS|nr:unnamed protein product [Microthlaspi erraticum]